MTGTDLTGAHPRSPKDERPGIWTGYGKLLKLFRENAGLSQEALGQLLGYSAQLVASVEQGRRPAKAPFTEAAEGALEAGGALRALQREVDFAKLPPFFRDFVALEMDAVSRCDYEPQLIPGLLQTGDYAREVFAGHCPPLADEAVEQRVEARTERQKLLTRSPLVDFSFVIGEAALRNRLGPSEQMNRQYAHLLETARLRNVSIQIMPTERGFHPGLNGPMVLVETAAHQKFGYFESQGIGHVVSSPAEVSFLGLRYGKLRSMALDVRESVAFVKQLAGEK